MANEDWLKATRAWCMSVVGRCELASDDVRYHGRTTVCRLRTASGYCYLKIHRERASWETEVHAYERWVPALGDQAPRLLAVREEEPLALLISELPGRTMADVDLPADRERSAWRAAGRALAGLHRLAQGECFGPGRRDGTCTPPPISQAEAYVRSEFDRWLDTGQRGGYLSQEELGVVRAALDMVDCFAGERPVPCHRDYCPVNWVVDGDGVWAGVIDFEFAYWDVLISDFSRYPDWEWLRQPDLVDALLEGYGRPFTPAEERQLLVHRTLYALSAIVWGIEHEMFGFAEEGREALRQLAGLLR